MAVTPTDPWGRASRCKKDKKRARKPAGAKTQAKGVDSCQGSPIRPGGGLAACPINAAPGGLGSQRASGQGEEEEDECRGAPRKEAESPQQHPSGDEPEPHDSPADRARLLQTPDVLPHPRHPLGWGREGSAAGEGQERRVRPPGGRGAGGGRGGGRRGQLGPGGCPRAPPRQPSSPRSIPSPSPRDTPRGGRR